jgi:ribosomal-protein-alanine N-acetyltransferase
MPNERQAIQWRPMIRADMDQVRAIELESFADPWVHEDFMKALRQRNVMGYVAEGNGGQARELVLGFVIYELHPSRLHILNLATHPAYLRFAAAGALFIASVVWHVASGRWK